MKSHLRFGNGQFAKARKNETVVKALDKTPLDFDSQTKSAEPTIAAPQRPASEASPVLHQNAQ